MKMKYGLDGQMIVTTQCEPWATDQDQPDTAEHIKILATEIELLTAELEEEKSAAKVQQRECGEHVHKLRTAEQELSSCQEALNTSEWEVNRVRVEMKEKTGELATVKGELLGCKQYVEQLAAEKHTSASVQKQAESEQTIKELLTKLSEREKEVADYQRRHKELTQMHEDYKSSIADQLAEIDGKHSEQQADLLTKLDKSEKEIRNVRAASSRDKKEMNELRRQVRGSGQERSGRDNEVEKLEQHLTSRNMMIEKLSRDLEAMQIRAKKVPGLAAQLARFEAENKELIRNAEALQVSLTEEKASSARVFTEAQTKNADLAQQLSKHQAILKEERKRSFKSIADLESKHASLTVDFATNEKVIEILERENNKSSERILDLNSKHDRLEEQISALEKQKLCIQCSDF